MQSVSWPPFRSCRVLRECSAVFVLASASLWAQTQPAPSPPAPAPKPAAKQSAVVAFGILTGGQIRDWFNSSTTQNTTFIDNSGKFMIGPTLRVYFVRWMCEVDALYRGYGAESSGNVLGLNFSNVSSGRAWEFPLMAKRLFTFEKHFKMFVGTGISFRYVGQTSTLSGGQASSPQAIESSDSTLTFGIPFSAGVELRSGRFRFTPELRYTLWTADKSLALVRTSDLWNPNVNQFAVLFGLTF